MTQKAFDIESPTGPFAPPRPRRSMLDTPALAWQAAADRLTEWTVNRMVVHPEVYGSYDRPFTIRRRFRHEWQTIPVWLRPVSREGMSKWFVITVDHHCDDARQKAVVNWQAAAGWHEELQRRGFKPLLLDSNGGEDIELLVLLSEEIPASRVLEFVQRLVSDYAARGLAQAPEFLPNQADIEANYGRKGWRLLGQHPEYRHFTRVWDGERWLEREEAIEAILATTGDSPDLIPDFSDSVAN
jgi:hypothetical protein